LFDFFDSDAFNIGLEIAFLAFIGYDARKYFLTKRREYAINIVLAIGFFIWAAIPFYNKYYTWSEAERNALQAICEKEESREVCECLTDTLTKEYSFSAYEEAYESPEQKAFTQEAKKECLEG